MNYAWANPTTGFREQAEKLSDASRMLAEAKRRVWEELQEVDPAAPGAKVYTDSHYGFSRFQAPPFMIEVEPCGKPAEREGLSVCFLPAGHKQPCFHPPTVTLNFACQIWRQERIGSVTVNGPTVDAAAIAKLNAKDPDYSFAWTEPEIGKRIVAANFPGIELVDALKALQERRDSINEVLVYATWPECVVHRSDPEPPSPVEEVFPCPDALRGDPARPPSAIDVRRAELDEVIVLEDATKIGKVSAWALLEIAEWLSLLVDSQQKPKHPARRLGLWERFKLWVSGDPIEDNPIKQYDSEYGGKFCQLCGELMGDGSPLICPKCAQEIMDKYLRDGVAWREGQRSGGPPRDEKKEQAEALERFDASWDA